VKDVITDVNGSLGKVKDSTEEFAIHTSVRSKTENLHAVIKETIQAVLKYNSQLLEATSDGFVINTKDVTLVANQEILEISYKITNESEGKEEKFRSFHNSFHFDSFMGRA
jgi:hypothetical protein